MDDQLSQVADEFVTLTPDQKTNLEQRIARLQCAAAALRALAARPYFSAEQAALILAEADDLLEKDIEPLRAALRDMPMSEILRPTHEELWQAEVVALSP